MRALVLEQPSTLPTLVNKKSLTPELGFAKIRLHASGWNRRDYWIIKGPVLDIVQAIFFKLFGVSWFSYVFHASIFNSIFSIATFYTFYKLKLNIKYF